MKSSVGSSFWSDQPGKEKQRPRWIATGSPAGITVRHVAGGCVYMWELEEDAEVVEDVT